MKKVIFETNGGDHRIGMVFDKPVHYSPIRVEGQLQIEERAGNVKVLKGQRALFEDDSPTQEDLF